MRGGSRHGVRLEFDGEAFEGHRQADDRAAASDITIAERSRGRQSSHGSVKATHAVTASSANSPIADRDVPLVEAGPEAS